MPPAGFAPGARTCAMISHWKTSARDATVAPAATNDASGNPASSPAPCSTTTSTPSFFSAGSTTGTSATRRSPGNVSFGTPIFIGQEFTAVSDWRRERNRQPALTNAAFNHSITGEVTSGPIVRTASDSYSSTSPVTAGSSRWLIFGRMIFRVASGGRACARAPAPPDGQRAKAESACRARHA